MNKPGKISAIKYYEVKLAGMTVTIEAINLLECVKKAKELYNISISNKHVVKISAQPPMR